MAQSMSSVPSVTLVQSVAPDSGQALPHEVEQVGSPSQSSLWGKVEIGAVQLQGCAQLVLPQEVKSP
ncbi:MAG: hypothetical protein IID40_06445 [Planctomycetes bacterium]|nr:hypothetical protein [Planctomycetota bacterium]